MIEQKAIYEAAQTAFKHNHPTFPFPKKHNLEDQTDEFKRAFLHLSTEINAMHQNEIDEVKRGFSFRQEMAAEVRETASRRLDMIRDLRDIVDSKNNKITFAWLIIGILVGGIIIYAMNQPADCIAAEDLAPGQPYMNFEGAKVAFEGEKGSMKAVHICE